MDLIRYILLQIEEEYKDAALYNLKVLKYEKEEIAYNCKLLYEKGLISYYRADYADNHLYAFVVGALTWEGHDYLDRIRDNTTWGKVKSTINENKLPFMIETVKEVSSAFIESAVAGVVKGIKS